MEEESILIRDLQSNSRSDRLAALEAIIAQGGSVAVLETLKQTSWKDCDAELKVLLSHATSTLQRRLQPKAGAPVAPIEAPTAETFAQFFTQKPPEEKLQILSQVKGKTLTSLVPQSFQLLSAEENPAVAARLIRLFGKAWPAETLKALLPYLESESLNVRTAALEILISRDPKSLTDSLSKLLSSEDFRLRALAVRGLAQTDPDEADLYLESMLLEGDASCRTAALQSALLMPFERTKPILLKFLAAETSLETLKKAVLLFRLNPDPETPFRIWEIAEKSPPSKAALLQEMVQGACKALIDSQILKDDLQQYTARLQEWIQKRSAMRFVQEFISRITQGALENQDELKALFTRGIAKPFVRSTFEASLEYEIPDAVKEKLRSLLPAEKSATPQPLPSPVPHAEPATKTTAAQSVPPVPATDGQSPQSSMDGTLLEGATSQLAPQDRGKGPMAPAITRPSSGPASSQPADRLKVLATWEKDRAKEAKVVITEILADKKTFEALLGTAFREATRFEIKGFEKDAQALLKKSDSGIVTNAMEYLAFANPDALIPYLGQYLQSDDLRIKSTALKILKQEDVPQAVSVLMTMIRSTSAAERTAGLNCVVFFDFPLLRDKLCDILLEKPTDEFLKPILYQFEANVDPDNLYPLFRLSKKLEQQAGALAGTVFKKSIESLASSGRLDREKAAKLEGEFSARWNQENAKKAAPPPPYAFKKKTPPPPPAPPAVWEAAGEKVISFAFQYWIHLAGAFMVVFAIVIVLVFIQTKNMPKGVMLHKPVKIRGIVQDILTQSGEIRLKTKDGMSFLLPIENFSETQNKTGKKLEMTVIPVMYTPENEIVAKVKPPIKETSDE